MYKMDASNPIFRVVYRDNKSRRCTDFYHAANAEEALAFAVNNGLTHIYKNIVEVPKQFFPNFENISNGNTDEDRARFFAYKKHADQKYGTGPYTIHLDAVRQVLKDFDWVMTDIIVSGWLHDTIEDTNTTQEEINALFGAQVARIVWACSGVGKNRKERNESIYAKLKECPEGVCVKLADRIANVESAKANDPKKFEMYKKEYEAFESALLPLDNSITDMWDRLDTVFLG